ncbi:alpha/beta hydrolase [Maritimibacter sp. 55A14]|nr:alpha/beta hydrolase [Maritimibacter sp. 55A14]
MLAALAAATPALAYWVDRRAGQREAEAEAAWPPRGRFLDVDGARLHVEVTGEGPDLVLLHGAGGNTRAIMAPFVDALARDFRIIAFDRPGLGYSDPLHGLGESPAEQARVLIRAARTLGVERPLVLGHSYGGAVALAWALEAPERTAGLVLLAGAAQEWPGRLAPFYRHLGTGFGQRVLIPLITAFLPRARLEASVRAVFAPQSPPPGYFDTIGAPLSIRRGALRHNIRQVNALRPHLAAMSPRYGTLRLPVEILHGTADDTVPIDVHSRPLARQLPDARLTVLDGIGHMPHHAATEDTLAAIRRVATRARLHSPR